MADTFNVHVMHHLEHLFEVIARDFCRESADCNVVEEFTARDKLHNYVGNLDLFAVGLDKDSVFFVVKQTNHVGMVEVLVHIDFVLQGVEDFGAVAGVALVEDLDGHVSPFCVGGELDFGRNARAESLGAYVLVNLRGHLGCLLL